MSARIFYLWFDGDSRRYMRHRYGLHCGNAFEAMIGGKWVPTRIEHSSASTHSHGWYLTTHPDQELEDLPVKEER